MKYKITIYYTEPTFQENIGSEWTYHVTFECCLPPGSEQKAKEMALDLFRWNEVNRSVQWNSEIIRVEVNSKTE